MSQPWENPDYAGQRGRRRRRVLVPLLLVAIVAAAFWALRNNAPGKAPAAAGIVPRSLAVADSARNDLLPAPAANPADEPPGSLPLGDPVDFAKSDALPAANSGDSDDFPARKALALSLYRQNKLTEAMEQAQAALARQRDDELLELLAKLKREIEVQRDYDQARTANFVVLFDGYEHEEMKVMVLDILKDAYAGIGKELDYFPAEPISVILYTGKDFSDVTHAPGWAGGMFGKVDGKIRLAVQGAEGQERALRRVLTHEYVHALLHALAPATPLWLHEGLAQLLSGDQAVNVAQVIPLGLLAGGFPRQARLAYVAYMESLQAVQDLVDEYGMPRLRRLLAGLGAGGDLETAFSAAYGEPFSRWAAGWRPAEGRDAEATAQDAGKKMDKKEIRERYKRIPPDMGVYMVKNMANGKIYIARAMDLKGKLNSERFQLGNGLHGNKELQRDFDQIGMACFAFEVLDRLEVKPDSGYDYDADLRTLEALWLEKLQPYAEKGYHRRKP